jgi:hypothetical protein
LRRKYDINIVTLTEDHGGPYSGTHARYVLRQRVEFAEPEESSPTPRPTSDAAAAMVSP